MNCPIPVHMHNGISFLTLYNHRQQISPLECIACVILFLSSLINVLHFQRYLGQPCLPPCLSVAFLCMVVLRFPYYILYFILISPDILNNMCTLCIHEVLGFVQQITVDNDKCTVSGTHHYIITWHWNRNCPWPIQGIYLFTIVLSPLLPFSQFL